MKKERKFSVTQLTLSCTTKTTSSLMTNIRLFSQIIAKLDRSKFSKIVKEKQTDKYQKGFSSWDAFGLDAILSVC